MAAKKAGGTPTPPEATTPEPAVRITPDLTPQQMVLSVQDAADTIGVRLNAAELSELLESMGYEVAEFGRPDRIKVLVPAYRNATWVPGHWDRRGHGWVWVPGHWRR